MGGHRLKDGSFFPIFSNEELEFNLKLDGTINSDIDDSSETSDMYAAKGCIAYSIEEANEVYAKMFKTKKINKNYVNITDLNTYPFPKPISNFLINYKW